MIKKYMHTKRSLLGYIFIIATVINVMFRLSMPLYKHVDSVYTNILFGIVTCLYLIYDYYAFKQRYYHYEKTLTERQSVDKQLLNGTEYEVALLKRTITHLEKEREKEIRQFKDNLEEVDSYLTVWTHQIKIPLTVCQLLADELEEAYMLSGKAEELRHELERIRYYIQQAIYISRANNFHTDIYFEEVSLATSVKEVIKNNKLFLIHKNIACHLDVEGEVLTDKKWLAYILDQLINNACKYSNHNGNIDIWTENTAEALHLHIKDNGIGIVQSDLQRVFQKGFTGYNGRNNAKSTGMGLYLVHKMVQLLEHQIVIESVEKSFTHVKISFQKK